MRDLRFLQVFWKFSWICGLPVVSASFLRLSFFVAKFLTSLSIQFLFFFCVRYFSGRWLFNASVSNSWNFLKASSIGKSSKLLLWTSDWYLRSFSSLSLVIGLSRLCQLRLFSALKYFSGLPSGVKGPFYRVKICYTAWFNFCFYKKVRKYCVNECTSAIWYPRWVVIAWYTETVSG